MASSNNRNGGRGVMNYSASNPSFGFSTKTTEFDDALLERNIITFEQAMLAKGATPHQAQQLAAEHHQQQQQQASPPEDPLSQQQRQQQQQDEEDDHDFLQRYREQRLEELQNRSNQGRFGQVVPISRPDWSREVNDASRDGTWVVVVLRHMGGESESHLHADRCQLVEDALDQVAKQCANIKFVSLPSKHAIENWPDSNLPSLFCYCHGTMQHQMIGFSQILGKVPDERTGIRARSILQQFHQLGIVTEVFANEDEEEEEERTRILQTNGRDSHHRDGEERLSGGDGMAQMATHRRDSDSDDDYDEID
mmetsp:Transcript_24362/g.44062  ORF Transcript_24362/g.44062 Transcript_24362/m.44062 type:complete len:309 (-) Transcript_24362:68-994(-)